MHNMQTLHVWFELGEDPVACAVQAHLTCWCTQMHRQMYPQNGRTAIQGTFRTLQTSSSGPSQQR